MITFQLAGTTVIVATEEGKAPSPIMIESLQPTLDRLAKQKASLKTKFDEDNANIDKNSTFLQSALDFIASQSQPGVTAK